MWVRTQSRSQMPSGAINPNKPRAMGVLGCGERKATHTPYPIFPKLHVRWLGPRTRRPRCRNSVYGRLGSSPVETIASGLVYREEQGGADYSTAHNRHD